jgi:hypothetical protein
MFFAAVMDWWGFTHAESGSDLLPADKGPWQPHHTRWLVSRDYPIQRPVANDLEIIAGIETQGYHVCRADPDKINRMLRGDPAYTLRITVSDGHRRLFKHIEISASTDDEAIELGRGKIAEHMPAGYTFVKARVCRGEEVIWHS